MPKLISGTSNLDNSPERTISPCHKKNAYQNTEEFLVYILHNDIEYITETGIEKVFVDNCTMFGVTYFSYVFTTLYTTFTKTLQSQKEELVKIVEEDVLDKIYRYLSTYIVEFYVRESRFGSLQAIFDVVRQSLSTGSLDMIKFLYDKCATSVETCTYHQIVCHNHEFLTIS